ncbi:MAG TPA: hypothetical protein VFE47_21955 [Tepidisphaeraceae bacterium]|jgi:hypothetical protein|nr:hypothetical protein [Tepidisphaeraceae bacterium]
MLRSDRSLAGFVVLLVMAFVAPGGVSRGAAVEPADPIDGRWNWWFDYTPGLIVQVEANLVRKGNTLTGKLSWGSEKKREAEVLDGKIDGRKISFTIKWKGIGDVTDIYSGELVNGEIKGTIQRSITRSGQTQRHDFPWDGVHIKAAD